MQGMLSLSKYEVLAGTWKSRLTWLSRSQRGWPEEVTYASP